MKKPEPRKRPWLRRAAAPAACALFAAACGHFAPDRAISRSVAPAPAIPWTPPPEGRPPQGPSQKLEIPEEYTKPGTTLSLAQLVDVALRNNPRTREAWHFARAAAAEVGVQRAEFFPVVELDGSITRQKTAAVGGRFTFLQTTYGPAASLNWLLFDFGGRTAAVAEAQAALYAADWVHNSAIQDVVLQVAQAYYGYLNAKALVAARQSNLEEARRNLEAAQERHRAGVATIADVLQARTFVSQVELNLQEAQGQVQVIRGALATAVGVPATIPVDVGELPEELPLDRTQQSIEELIARASAERPELAARRFEAEAARPRIQSARAEGLPKLFASGTVNRTYYYNSTGAPFSDNYGGSILMTIPVFTGLDTLYNTRKAEEEAAQARAAADRTEDQVTLEVWTSYYGVQTAAQRVKTSRDLLSSAAQSAEVAQGRYKEGVGSILDLLTAQAALSNARAQEVEARSLWFLAMARLAHSTGALLP
ncbi:MAG: TolC family protein, partial [Thermoanaerobaculia bacterium]